MPVSVQEANSIHASSLATHEYNAEPNITDASDRLNESFRDSLHGNSVTKKSRFKSNSDQVYSSISSPIVTQNSPSNFSTNPRAPLFRRSNSVSIPVSENDDLNSDNRLSRSYSSSKQPYPYYGSVNRDEDYHPSVSKCIPENASSSESVSSDANEGPTEKLYFGYTRRQLNVFCSLVLLSLNDLMGFSAIATFFPVVAESKGLSASQVGLVFASYSLFGVFASLIVGTVVVKVGAKFCVLAGMFWNTGAIFCFGFLNQSSQLPFFILCICCRGLMGFGSNGSFTAMFAIVFQEFSERSITVLSLSEALVGVGGMIAPLIGGALYDAGGYITPFMVLGGAQLLLLIACWYLLPYVPVEKKTASKPPLYLLLHSSALIATLYVIFVFAANGFVTVNISTYLKAQFDMNAVMVGVTLLVSSVCYAGMSPIWGYIADKWKNSYMMEGCIVGVAIGLILMGPAEILRNLFGWEKQHEWLIFVAAIINGAFFGGAIMPTFNDMILGAKELKMSDSMLAQYGLVSGLFNTAFSIGDVLGPTVGGVMVEHFGFPNSGALFGAVGLFLCVLKLIQRFYRYQTRHKRESNEEEEEPLLSEERKINV